ncbi:MAG: hypothetical protein H0X24_04785 [Ktedonobacterales bacterium]|nr:hypothetical protein [Ktedonobacterales bacterium]
MAMQFVTRDEYNNGNDQLLLRMNAIFGAQLDIMRTEMRANTAQILNAIGIRFDKSESDLAELRTFQRAMTEATKAQADDIVRTMRELHAQAMEEINDLRPKNIE